ncbi:TPA: type 3 fimbria usher protein MrkC, partial [Klebsiella pneumoniae]|nr:type 3 fimbria usher protein MrkC [Klebsiella pneumoniae]
PDGMRSYAPEIRGVAQSNALVTVRQGSNIIYQTTVPPGPFTLQDVYPSGYGSDLEVSVKEADGSVEVFSVPYASVAQLLRPGMTRYALSAGKVDDSALRNKPMLYQATWQHGINNLLTGYTGVTGFDDYQAFLVGTGMNTGIGALSFDVTHSRLKSDAHDDSGQSYRATFNRMFTDTQTSIVLAAYRYSTKGYYNLNDALYAVDQEKNSRSNYTLWRQKNGITFTVNQNLPDGWGGFYLSGRISDYWNRSGTEKQYQVSYNNSFGRLSWSASAQRVYTPDSSGHRRDDRISLNFSYPLWFGDNRTANLTSNTSFNNSRFASSQIGINGSLDSENNLNYGVSTTTATGGQHDVALNGSYRTPWTTLNGSYSQGEGYRQSGIGASGTMIAHSGGVVLSPESGSTMALIEAKDAAGAMLPGSPGTRVDSNGYAILPYLRPYRINAVEIDPKGSHDDVAFDRTVAQVVPWEGSVVKVAFGTKVQNNLTLQARQANHEPLPFAASIFSPDGKEIGVVGQGSMMFISDANAKRAIVKWSGGQCSVDLGQQTTKDSVCR